MKENAINISCAETNTTWLLEGIRFFFFNEIFDNRVFGDFLRRVEACFYACFYAANWLPPVG